MQITYTTTPEHAAASALSQLLKECREPVLLLLSGGSSLGFLDLVDLSACDSRCTIGMLDERFSTDPAINNFSQLMVLPFYARAKERGCRFIDSRFSQNETIDEAAGRLENALREWRLKHPGGKTVITLGVGPDGHTSGVLPFPEDPALFEKLFQGERWVVGYDAVGKNEHRLRISVTITFLLTVQASISYVKGEAKRDALHRILADSGSLAETPGRIIRSIKNAVIITDVRL